MKTSRMRQPILITSLCAVLGIYQPLIYATTIPNTVQPSHIEQSLARPLTTMPTVSENIAVTKPLPSKILGAKKIKFRLKKIIITGNHIFTKGQLLSLFNKRPGDVISLYDLEQLSNEITKLYGNTGFILSKAILPAQTIKNGMVKVRVIEGYVGHVQLNIADSVTKRAAPLLLALANKIKAVRPLTSKALERYTLLANDIPGIQVKTILKASNNQPLAADLTFLVKRKFTNLFASWDNRGTQALGPKRYLVDISRASIISGNGITGVRGVNSDDASELRFWELYHNQLLTDEGLMVEIAYNTTLTAPERSRTAFAINGHSKIATISLSYPLIRSRLQNLYLDSSLTVINSNVQLEHASVYTDNTRNLSIGFSDAFSDNQQGFNNIAVHFNQGLNLFGASPQRGSLSRADGHIVYSSVDVKASRTQWLTPQTALFAAVDSQYAFNNLLVAQEFGFGGNSMGLAYDGSELLGDSGFAAKIELRHTVSPNKAFLEWLQYFAFYEIGKIWNHHAINQVTQLSAADLGIGLNIRFNQTISGQAVWAKPLTLDVAAKQNRKPRGFFTLMLNL